MRTGPAPTRTVAERVRQQRVQASGSPVEWNGVEADRIWLRGTTALTGTLGAALIGVATATYLMAIGHDGPSWAVYGVAGVITAATPVIEVLYVRQLRRVIASQYSLRH